MTANDVPTCVVCGWDGLRPAEGDTHDECRPDHGRSLLSRRPYPDLVEDGLSPDEISRDGRALTGRDVWLIRRARPHTMPLRARIWGAGR